jgi:low affinity Fe/Cu permease
MAGQGFYASHPAIANDAATGQRGGLMAACRNLRAAEGDAGAWLSRGCFARAICSGCGRAFNCVSFSARKAKVDSSCASPPIASLKTKRSQLRFLRGLRVGSNGRSAGSSTFLLAIAVVVLWAASGPIFDWSDTWQLVINTATTIVTFLMVFVIQNTQTRDTQAMQLKLDELIRVNAMTRNSLISLEEMPEADVERMKTAFTTLATIGSTAEHPAEGS